VSARPKFAEMLAASYKRRGVPMPEPIVEIPAPHVRETYCTHPNQAWCDCDWCRVVRGQS